MTGRPPGGHSELTMLAPGVEICRIQSQRQHRAQLMATANAAAYVSFLTSVYKGVPGRQSDHRMHPIGGILPIKKQISLVILIQRKTVRRSSLGTKLLE
jgi:hypothetical protein